MNFSDYLRDVMGLCKAFVPVDGASQDTELKIERSQNLELIGFNGHQD
jgi:hypothetical protein